MPAFLYNLNLFNDIRHRASLFFFGTNKKATLLKVRLLMCQI